MASVHHIYDEYCYSVQTLLYRSVTAVNPSCTLLDEPAKELNLDAYATTTSITDLTPDVDYSVSINSFYGSEESIPIFGQVTSEYMVTH